MIKLQFTCLLSLVIFSSSVLVAETTKEKQTTNLKKPEASSVKGAKAGERRVFEIFPGVKQAFRWCPATGEEGFLMGSAKGLGKRDQDETQHKVVLTKGFWLQETEFTQGQWKTIMKQTVLDLSARRKGIAPIYGVGKDHPVYYVQWTDTQHCIKKLNQAGSIPKGLKASLPTEAQWEYACRAGTKTTYPSNKKLSDVAWIETRRIGTSPVGTKLPNPWGLYNMLGNVCEWCADKYAPYPLGPQVDPKVETKTKGYVLRGGAWMSGPESCRSADRGAAAPERLAYYVGFRLALQVESDKE